MNPSKMKALLRSLLISYILSGLLLLAAAFALYRLKLGEDQINLAVYGVYALSCFTGGLLCGKSLKVRRFFWGLLLGLSYFAVLLGASCLMNRNLPADMARPAAVLLVCLLSGLTGGMAS
ncbi:MAG: TIGR04086 family membrane protein [Eubacteriales bacterium]|nr:TIGR04086 family membrane protein [Eubacteriales bacterium]